MYNFQDFFQNFLSKEHQEAFLKTLNAQEGTLIGAYDWRLTNSHHQLRQKFLNITLCQPGILFGFQIKLLDYAQGKMKVKIYPGVAIDKKGQIIVLKEPKDYLLDNIFQKQLIFLCVAYSPDNTNERYQEDNYALKEYTEKNYLQQEINFEENIELFRIQLSANYDIQTNSKEYVNYLFPKINEIDLRFRKNAYPFLEGSVNISIIISNNVSDQDRRDLFNFNYLEQASKVIYPRLNVPTPKIITLDNFSNDQNQNCDLFYLRYEGDLDNNNLTEIFQKNNNLIQSIQENKQLLLINSNNLNFNNNQNIDVDNQNIKFRELKQEDYCCQHPFLFDVKNLPINNIYLAEEQGIIVTGGNISSSWGIGGGRSREQIRSAHEFGINILHYAWKRRSLFQIFKQS